MTVRGDRIAVTSVPRRLHSAYQHRTPQNAGNWQLPKNLSITDVFARSSPFSVAVFSDVGNSLFTTFHTGSVSFQLAPIMRYIEVGGRFMTISNFTITKAQFDLSASSSQCRALYNVRTRYCTDLGSLRILLRVRNILIWCRTKWTSVRLSVMNGLRHGLRQLTDVGNCLLSTSVTACYRRR